LVEKINGFHAEQFVIKLHGIIKDTIFKQMGLLTDRVKKEPIIIISGLPEILPFITNELFS